MQSSKIKTICRIALLAALYVLLNNTIAIKAGTIRITFASLPVMVAALLFGPGEAALTALTGELINQLYSYGMSTTMFLWLIPPAVRGCIIGMAAARFRGTERPLERRPILAYAVCVGAAVITTFVNTAVMAADALLMGYYTWVYVFGRLAERLVSGVVVAVVVTTVALPLTARLRGIKGMEKR